MTEQHVRDAQGRIIACKYDYTTSFPVALRSRIAALKEALTEEWMDDLPDSRSLFQEELAKAEQAWQIYCQQVAAADEYRKHMLKQAAEQMRQGGMDIIADALESEDYAALEF